MSVSENAVQEFNPHTVVFTDSAAQKVAELIREEGDLDLSLRAFITGGGCSGFQYGFTFEKAQNSDDFIFSKSVKNPHDEAPSEVKLLIDPMSFQYLVGATIDYREDLQGAQFIIKNPNAKTTCGCGSSFSVD